MEEPETSPIMKLPAEVRKRIWGFAGLVRPCPIPVAQEKSRARLKNEIATFKCGRYHDQSAEYEEDNIGCLFHKDDYSGWICNHKALPTALFYVNKSIRAEATEVLFGQNKLYINCTDEGILELLNRLPAEAWQHLRELHLNYDADNDNGERYWRNLCNNLKRHLRSGLTRVYLTAESPWPYVTLEMAKSILPALIGLPHVKSLSIYFGKGFRGSRARGAIKDADVFFDRDWLDFLRPILPKLARGPTLASRLSEVLIAPQNLPAMYRSDKVECCGHCYPTLGVRCLCGVGHMKHSTSCSCPLELDSTSLRPKKMQEQLLSAWPEKLEQSSAGVVEWT